MNNNPNKDLLPVMNTTELKEILEEITETQTPGKTQQKRWKRMLRKGIEKSRKFVEGIFEKGTDTIVSEKLKEWLTNNGLEQLMQWVQSLAP